MVKDDKGIQDQIKEFEDELKKTKYNKRTQSHIGLVKAKIAKLKDKDEQRRSSGGKGEGYSVKKSGDVTAVLLGFPSVGKSTILNVLTNANSEVGSYDFTTLDVIPGLLEHKFAKIQVLDVPGIVSGAASGRGRGREVLSVLRATDLVIVIIDAQQPQQYEALLKEIYDAHIRINKTKPVVKIKKTAKDGVKIGSTVKLNHIDHQTIKNILKEFRIMNADVLIRDDITIDEFIDAIEGNKVYIPSILIVNKIDLCSQPDYKKLEELKPDLMISAKNNLGTDEFKDLIYNKVGLMNIYLKEPGKDPDLKEPLVIRSNSTIKNLCEKLHKDFVTKFKFIRLWGSSAKFPGQRLLKMNHILKNNDIVEIHLK
jgi:uncharacterized protein